MDERRPGGSPDAGLLATLRRLAANAVALLHARLELILTEIDEERSYFIRVLVLSIVAAFFLTIGAVALTLLVVLLVWDTHRVLAAGVLTALYLAIAAGIILRVRALVQGRHKLLASSLEELRKDRDALRESVDETQR